MKEALIDEAFKFQNLKERLLKIDRNLSCAESILSFGLSRYEYGYKFLNSISSCLRQSYSEHSAPAAYFFISTPPELDQIHRLCID